MSEVDLVLARVRETAERGIAIARDARAARFRRKLGREYLAEVPPWPLSEEQRADALRFLSQFSPRYRDLTWHQAYASARGRFDAGLIPEDIYFVALEAALNPRERQPVIGDKNRYDRLNLPLCVPETVARVVRGKLVGADYRPLTSQETAERVAAGQPPEVVLKPALGGMGGEGVAFLSAESLPPTLEPLLERQGIYDDWLAQRVVKQCDELAALNAGSVNTMRIMTYRSQSRGVMHVSSVLRMGRAGSRVDNKRQGGVTCGIVDGTLRPTGHLGWKMIEAHPDSGVRFEGFHVPSYREALAACLSGHEAIPAMDLISWDIAIDCEGRPTLIEFNTHHQGIQMHQMENGPLPPEIVAEWAARAPFWLVGGLVIRKRVRD